VKFFIRSKDYRQHLSRCGRLTDATDGLPLHFGSADEAYHHESMKGPQAESLVVDTVAEVEPFVCEATAAVKARRAEREWAWSEDDG
jgi:hypothetical protein